MTDANRSPAALADELEAAKHPPKGQAHFDPYFLVPVATLNEVIAALRAKPTFSDDQIDAAINTFDPDEDGEWVSYEGYPDARRRMRAALEAAFAEAARCTAFEGAPMSKPATIQANLRDLA